MLNTSLWDAQTTYGSGSLGVVPSNSTSAMDNLYSAWGAKMSGQLAPQFDGVSRPYVYSDNKDKYYQTGTTYSNTISFSTANENGNTRFSLTNLDNDDNSFSFLVVVAIQNFPLHRIVNQLTSRQGL